MTRFEPQRGHFSSRIWSGLAAFRPPCLVAMSILVVLHSGYPVHARNCPKRPRLTAIGLPQFSHGSTSSSPDSDSGCCSSSSRVLVHSGYPLQAMNGPNLPTRLSIGMPHLSHASPMSIPFLRSTISLPAFERSFLNFL